MSELKDLRDEFAALRRTREVVAQKAEGLERRAHRDAAEAEELNTKVGKMSGEIIDMSKKISKLEKKERKETA